MIREISWTSNRHENVYFPASNERVSLRVLDKRETSTAKARARETPSPIERLGSKRNQYGDALLTIQNCV